MIGTYEVLERREIAGGGIDALVRDSAGKEARLWLGAVGSADRADELSELSGRLARVYQSSLPRVLGSEVIGDRAALKLEPYRGTLLSTRLAGGALAPPVAIDVVRAGAAALVKAHAKGFVHGAIRPDDILLSEDGRTILLHLGMEPFLDPDRLEPLVAEAAATATAEAGDVFALARVLIHSIEGEDPFAGVDSLEGAGRDEHDFDGSLPQGLRRLLARAISPDPAHRMTRAEELAGDLGVIRAGWDSMSAPPKPGPGGRRARAIGLTVAALGVALLVLRWLFR